MKNNSKKTRITGIIISLLSLFTISYSELILIGNLLELVDKISYLLLLMGFFVYTMEFDPEKIDAAYNKEKARLSFLVFLSATMFSQLILLCIFDIWEEMPIILIVCSISTFSIFRIIYSIQIKKARYSEFEIKKSLARLIDDFMKNRSKGCFFSKEEDSLEVLESLGILYFTIDSYYDGHITLYTQKGSFLLSMLKYNKKFKSILSNLESSLPIEKREELEEEMYQIIIEKLNEL
ncbi:MAG: hypothetical protein PF542_05480 [Nanoarchaeota archaeon]|jgi:hypothetical protein|nr:hypothetical protein [Nanoarchaeota archaeon]